MSIEEAIKLLKEAIGPITRRVNVNKALTLLESEPEPGEFTKRFRAGCQVVYRDSNMDETKIKAVLKNTSFLGLEVRFAEARLNAKEGLEACDIIDRLSAELKAKDELSKELLSANPDCCWRKCWECKKVQIHREDVTPGVLCRFCGSQDTRLLRKETQAL